MIDNVTLDREVLREIVRRPTAPTYVIRNGLDWPGQPLHRKGLLTRQVLASCRRLEKRGYAKEASTGYLVMKCWEPTPGGRAFVSLTTPEEGE